jgi:hypothetical protein
VLPLSVLSLAAPSLSALSLSATANSVIEERSFMASTGPKIRSAELPLVPATTRAHSRSRGPSTGWAR